MINDYHPIQSPILQQNLWPHSYSYREYAPSKILAPYVACYWTMDFLAGVGDQLHRIIPDGCADIIVDRLSPSCWKSAFVAGLMTQFEVLSLSKAQSLFGIRFFSESAQTFLSFPVSAFIGNHIFLEEIWGTEGIYFVEKILSADSALEIVDIVESKLKHILSLNDLPSHSLVQTSMKYMYSFKGNMSTSALAEKLNFSERHLRRIFH